MNHFLSLMQGISVGSNVAIQAFPAGSVELDRSLERLIPRRDPLRQVLTHNKVPLFGRNIIRDLLGRGAPGTGSGYAPTHIALGDDGATTLDSESVLRSEVFRSDIVARAGDDSVLTLQSFLDTDVGNGLTFRETGLFDSPNAGEGNMLARAPFDPFSKTSAIQLVVTWVLTITAT